MRAPPSFPSEALAQIHLLRPWQRRTYDWSRFMRRLLWDVAVQARCGPMVLHDFNESVLLLPPRHALLLGDSACGAEATPQSDCGTPTLIHKGACTALRQTSMTSRYSRNGSAVE